MKKIKLLYIVTGLTAGGAEIMLYRIVKKIDKNKYEISVVSLTHTKHIVKLIKPFVEDIYILNLKSLANVVTEFSKLRKIIIKEKPEIIHCFMPHANLLGRFATFGYKCKLISSLWVVLLEKKYLNFFDMLSQRMVDLYTVNSNALKKFAIEYGILRNKIKVVESGVDLEKFQPKKDFINLRKELKLPDMHILTMVAHLRKQKDYPTMIRTLAILQADLDVCFLICGYGSKFEDETQNIKNLINKLNVKNVKLLGFRDDIIDILSITDIWVSSTLYEGQSNSLLEAMGMKKVIVTTNIPENAEVVRDGKEALLVPIRSPYKMASAIKKLINDQDLASKLSENAFKRVHKMYHIDNTINKLERIYQSLAKNK